MKALITGENADGRQTEVLAENYIRCDNPQPGGLVGILRDMGILLPLRLAKRLRRTTWTPGLRYETGRRDTGETRAFLKTAKEIYQ